jgi:hypothetical protein
MLEYNMCYHGSKAAINDRKVVSIILIKTKNKKISYCWNNSKFKYQTWQLTFSQQRKHNCNILLLKDKNKMSIKCNKPFCPMIETWHGEVPCESYSRNAFCALDFDIYVFITARRDSFLFRRDLFTTINLIYLCRAGIPYFSQTQTPMFFWEFIVLLFCFSVYSQ